VPDAFATLPKEWTPDQIQDYFDALMSGNLARKRMTKFMPADFRLIETRQPPLKDLYDEWLARIICYAFSVPASAFVSQVNRATSETLRLQATQEGLIPLKAWVKSALDHVIQVCMNEPGLEFVWVGDDAIDPSQQAQTLQILVSAGIETREEARAELGLGGAPPGGAPAGGAAAPERSDAQARLGKFNPYHDEQGRFTTAENAVDPGGATGVPPPVQLTRERIVAAAEKHVGSTAWSNAVSNGQYRAGTNKCNLFVYDVLTDAGASPGLPHGIWPISSYPPLAADWANPDFAIPGWSVLGQGEAPQAGDVVAQQISYSDAGGHVMIVGPDDTLIGTGDSDPAQPGKIEQIPMRTSLANSPDIPQGPLVFRRWVGDDKLLGRLVPAGGDAGLAFASGSKEFGCRIRFRSSRFIFIVQNPRLGDRQSGGPGFV
jgi:hypothetical protein